MENAQEHSTIHSATAGQLRVGGKTFQKKKFKDDFRSCTATKMNRLYGLSLPFAAVAPVSRCTIWRLKRSQKQPFRRDEQREAISHSVSPIRPNTEAQQNHESLASDFDQRCMSFKTETFLLAERSDVEPSSLGKVAARNKRDRSSCGAAACVRLGFQSEVHTRRIWKFAERRHVAEPQRIPPHAALVVGSFFAPGG